MKKKAITAIIFMALAAILWFVFNPRGQFGWCRFGFTIYSGIPRPISDIQVRSDGAVRKVTKTHELTLEAIGWLLEPRPEVLIIAIGWDGVTKPGPEIEAINDCEVRVLKSGDAIDLFNKLKKAGKRVAIHFHSTC